MLRTFYISMWGRSNYVMSLFCLRREQTCFRFQNYIRQSCENVHLIAKFLSIKWYKVLDYYYLKVGIHRVKFDIKFGRVSLRRSPARESVKFGNCCVVKSQEDVNLWGESPLTDCDLSSRNSTTLWWRAWGMIPISTSSAIIVKCCGVCGQWNTIHSCVKVS